MNKRKIFFIVALLISGFAVFNTPASAEGNEPVEISISPVSHKIEIEQGETYSGKVTVANVGKKEFNYEMSVKPYGVTDAAYTNVTFEANEYTDIVNWITFSQNSGHLMPNESEVIDFTITVPEKAFSIGQYLVIVASAMSEVQNGQSGLDVIGSVGSVVYASISGDAKNSGEITENSIPSFYFSGPIYLKSTVKNTGDVHNTAVYKLEVRSIFSDDIIYSNNDEPYTHLVLPKTERTESWTWDAPMFGIFRVKQTIEYAGETSVEEQTIIVCPLWLIIAVVVTILLVIIWIIAKAKKRRNNRAYLS